MVPAATAQPGIVSTYVVERYWPGVNAETLAAALERTAIAAGQLTQGGTVVRHLQSTLVPTEEVVFCLFEATSAEVVELVNRNADVAFDHITQAIVLATEANSPMPNLLPDATRTDRHADRSAGRGSM